MAKSENLEELKNSLKKLRPEARLKKLKELEQSRKDEISEIAELIKDSKKQLITEKIAEEIAPDDDDLLSVIKIIEEENALLNQAADRKAFDNETDAGGYSPVINEAYNDYTPSTGNASYFSETVLENLDTLGEIIDKSKYINAAFENINLSVGSFSVMYKVNKLRGLDTNPHD